MIKGMMAACVAAGVCVPAAPASAAYITGHKLHELCVENDDTFACTTYVAGVVDMLILMKELGVEKISQPCFPEGVTAGQLGNVFAKFLRDHPKKRHWEGMVLVTAAIREAFPCPAAD